jgi:ATP-dependent protease ClpP protease subunit
MRTRRSSQGNQGGSRVFLWYLAFLAFLTLVVPHGFAAEFRLADSERTDNLANGSIDVQGALGGQMLRKHLTSNMADEGVIICNFYLEGQIISGDAKRLQAIVATWRQKHKTDTPRLCLNSPGGSFEEGLLIARFLTQWVEGGGTAIEAGAKCFSACAIIFMAGTYPWIGERNRFLNVNGMIGFHAPYVDPSKMAGQTYSAPQLAAALNSGIQTVNQMVKLGRGRAPHFFDADLALQQISKTWSPHHKGISLR